MGKQTLVDGAHVCSTLCVWDVTDSGAKLGDCALCLYALLGNKVAQEVVGSVEANRTARRGFSGASSVNDYLCRLGSAVRIGCAILLGSSARQASSRRLARALGRASQHELGAQTVVARGYANQFKAFGKQVGFAYASGSLAQVARFLLVKAPGELHQLQLVSRIFWLKLQEDN